MSTIGVIHAGSGPIDRVTPPGGWGRPGRREGIVPRQRLATLLSGAADATAVVILAPAGYGKTTTTLLWEETDDRDFVWVHLDRLDDEPVHLLRHLAHALAAAGAIDPEQVKLLWGGRRSVDLELLPALGRALRLDGPIVLVLDDVHVVESAVAQRCIDGLAAYLPAGSQLALVGRSLPSGSLSERRMAGTTLELGAADLAMSEDEAELLFAGSGLQLETGGRRGVGGPHRGVAGRTPPGRSGAHATNRTRALSAPQRSRPARHRLPDRRGARRLSRRPRAVPDAVVGHPTDESRPARRAPRQHDIRPAAVGGRAVGQPLPGRARQRASVVPLSPAVPRGTSRSVRAARSPGMPTTRGPGQQAPRATGRHRRGDTSRARRRGA